MSLWRSVAKKEIRLKTSRFRKNRKMFFIAIYSLFLFWAFYIGPNFLDAILPEILKLISGNLASFTTLLIEYSFATLFLMYLIYPLFILFRKSQIPYKEFLISSPIEPKDVSIIVMIPNSSIACVFYFKMFHSYISFKK